MGRRKSRSIKKRKVKMPIPSSQSELGPPRYGLIDTRKDDPPVPKHDAIPTTITPEVGERGNVVNLPVVIEPKGKVHVQVRKDHTLVFPDLYLNIFVAPDPSVRSEMGAFALMFARSGCRKAATAEEADIVVFGGGSDVNPVLYGADKNSKTIFDDARDEADMALYLKCINLGIPMFGVCRGAQFLHVMNGGQLYQHINHHYGAHSIHDHNGNTIINNVSSVHHQACKSNITGGMEIIATARVSTERQEEDNVVHKGETNDIEAFFYRETCSLGVQGHPEYDGYNYYTKWCLEQINDYIVSNPDLDYKHGDGKFLRMIPELRNTASITPGVPRLTKSGAK